MLSIPVLVLAGFACLFPLALYCLVLASVNHRRGPTLVSGPLDFAGVLLASAGFLIVGGPLAMAGVHDTWRRAAARGSFAAIRTLLDEPDGPWRAAWIAYFVVVAGGALALLWRRRAVAAVYNVESGRVDGLLASLFDRCGFKWLRRGDTYFLSRPPAPPDAGSGPVVLEVTVAPVLRHATLRWRPARGPVRQEVEAELGRALAAVPSPDNPAVGWLLTTATVLFLLMLFGLTLLVLFLWFGRG